MFTPTGVEIQVPTSAILAFDLDVEELDTSRRTFRHHIRKWRLGSEDHARILQLLSESLDSIVDAALQNVSGRS